MLLRRCSLGSRVVVHLAQADSPSQMPPKLRCKDTVHADWVLAGHCLNPKGPKPETPYPNGLFRLLRRRAVGMDHTLKGEGLNYLEDHGT